MKILGILCCLFSITSGFTFITNLLEKRILVGVQYCPYNITQYQVGWSANQPPHEWLNITFPLRQHVQQMTGDGYLSAYIVLFSVDYGLGEVKVSIEYWYKPWVLWLSWPYELICPEINITYGSPPAFKS